MSLCSKDTYFMTKFNDIIKKVLSSHSHELTARDCLSEYFYSAEILLKNNRTNENVTLTE